MFGTHEKGRSGEDAARAHLERKGYKFLRANYRARTGEVDLVMERDDTVVFVEVKARGSAAFGGAAEAVTAAKQARVAKAALHYIKENNLAGRSFRFDVAAVGPDGVEHIENAFEAGTPYTL
ncbi:MAG: YraN family protein [Elusimicrobiota bacterium]